MVRQSRKTTFFSQKVAIIKIIKYLLPLKPDRVGGKPTADKRVIPAVDVVLEVGVGIKRLDGETEQERVRTGGEVAESVANQVGGGIANYVTDGTEMVGQGP